MANIKGYITVRLSAKSVRYIRIASLLPDKKRVNVLRSKSGLIFERTKFDKFVGISIVNYSNGYERIAA